MINPTKPEPNYGSYYNSNQLMLPIDLTFNFEENSLVSTFVEVMKGVDLSKCLTKSSTNGNTVHDPIACLTALIFGYVEAGHPSLRDLEEKCRYDTRYIWLSGHTCPSFEYFARLIKDNLLVSVDDLLTVVNLRIFCLDQDIDFNTLFIDGSKWEAYAKKTSFVWKKSVLKYQSKLFNKISKTGREMNETVGQLNSFKIKESYTAYDLEMVIAYMKLMMKKLNIETVRGAGHKRSPYQKYLELFEEYLDSYLKYEGMLEILGDRNSYSKTDHDATFMNMKYDYYNKTGVFKPGYNIQIGTMSGYVVHAGIFDNRSDVGTYISFMESYKERYKKLPKTVVADAGYGSYENYMWNLVNHVDSGMKYNMFNTLHGKSDYLKKNPYNSLNFKTNENGLKVCPAGMEMNRLVSETYSKKGGYTQIIQTYTCDGCANCKHQKECTKAKDGQRKIQVNRVLEELREDVDQRLLSEEGKELRRQRSIQTEGAFGVLKEDYDFDRLWRRGKENVAYEVEMCIIGLNIRKYHYKKIKKQEKPN